MRFLFLLFFFSAILTAKETKEFREAFFAPFFEISIEMAEAKLDECDRFKIEEWWGENLKKIKKERVINLVAAAKEAKKFFIFKNGVTTRGTNLRLLPTNKPFFKDPSKAGEGYPFDYLQESYIHISTPVKIVYQTKNGEYYFVYTSAGYGWIDSRDVAFCDDTCKESFMSAKLLTPTKDEVFLYDQNGKYLDKAHIGAVLPASHLYTKDGLLSYKTDTDSSLSEIKEAPNERDIRERALLLIEEPYGWGGAYANRDCSSFLRDIFVGSSILLPRNSAQQASGYTPLIGMTSSQKKSYLLMHAKPWRTLLYLKGHIMLYAGDKNGEPIAIHALWGIRSFKNSSEGREIIGKITITTLEEGIGKEWFVEEKSSLLYKLIGIKDIF